MIKEEELRKVIASNIAFYRKKAGFTQSTLAARLNYSDKSVSKWERAESIPDVYVLSLMAEIFGVTLNDITGSGLPQKQKMKLSPKKKIIPLLSALLVWLIAAIIFFVLELVPALPFKNYLVFIYAIPASFIVLTIFCCLWRGYTLRTICVSGIVWGIYLSLKLSLSVSQLNILVIAFAIFQVLVILWFYMKHRSKQVKNSSNVDNTVSDNN